MANSATAKTPINVSVWGQGTVIPYEVTIDTVDTDLTIRTPASDKQVGIVGINYAEASAHNLTFTSGSDLEVTFELPANSGISMGISKAEMLYCTQKGSALKIKSSAAISGPMILYVIEGRDFI